MNVIEWAFGKRQTPQERLRKHQRALEKAQRELDRERQKLEGQEKKLILEIKKSAKNGQMGACKIQAKDLVRTRRYIQKFYQMKTQLQAVSLRIQTRIAMEFERENDIMDQREEMMGDAIDDVTGLDDEEETDEVVNQVLDELGLDLGMAVSCLVTTSNSVIWVGWGMHQRVLRVKVRPRVRGLHRQWEAMVG
ncbi:hypothetical protein BGX38DRAFT_1173197 [Terfezia claveryi]|nr:hypothetical protein BGX38DRAFT_1173197 [Terfezia claveryi]